MPGGCCSTKRTKVEDVTSAYDPANEGPIKDRSCTDVLCLAVLVVFSVVWTGIAIYSFAHGNPAQLMYPSNSQGKICGKGDFSSQPYLLFFDLTRCIKISAALGGCSTPQVCVAACPTQYWSYVAGRTPDIKTYCTNLKDGEFEGTAIAQLVRARQCPAYILPSKQVLGRCIPTFADSSNSSLLSSLVRDDQTSVSSSQLTQGIQYLNQLLDLQGAGERLLADLRIYWWILLVALVLSIILAFAWIGLLRLAAAPLIWTSILVCLALLIGLTALSWFRYVWLLTAGDNAKQNEIFLPPGLSGLSSFYYNKTIWITAAILLSIFTLIMLIVFLFMRKRISIAIELIEEASKAVGSAIGVLFFPMGPFFGKILVIFWFALVASFLGSSGAAEYRLVDTCPAPNSCQNTLTQQAYADNQVCNPDTFNCTTCPQAKCVFHKFGPNNMQIGFQVYNIVGLFWFLFFVEAFGEMTLAGVFAGWYWTFDKKHDLPSNPILSSLWRTFRYHLGTLAFGSLILTIVRMIRLVIQFIQEQIEKRGGDNTAVKVIGCLCQCCFYCMEKFIKFLNRNAYIMTAVHGENFCAAAASAFSLLLRNAARVAALDMVTDFVLFIGKLMVVGLVLAVTVLLLRLEGAAMEDLHYQIVPIILTIILAFVVSTCFFSVYNMAVDTIFLSFLEDIEKHDGSAQNPYFMNEDLCKILGVDNLVKKPEEE